MLTLKRKNLTLAMLALLGLVYFNTMSNLLTNTFLKSEIALIQLQILAIIYVTYQRWSRGYRES